MISRQADPLSGRPDGHHTQEDTEVSQSRASESPTQGTIGKNLNKLFSILFECDDTSNLPPK